MNVAERIGSILLKSQRILIIIHIYPDGDCIGSSLALWLGLQSLGKDVMIVSEHAIPSSYDFLPGNGEIRLSSTVSGEFDMIVAVDVSEKGRMGSAVQLFEQGKTTINIDHHTTNENFAMINWIESNVAATGELIYRLLKTMNIKFTKEIAICLYTAISTDTGSFRFSNTTAEAFSIAAHLVAMGANPGEIGEYVFDTKPLNVLKLLGVLLGGLETSKCGKVAWMTLTAEMMDEFSVMSSDVEGFVNYARMIDGINVALLFREEGSFVKVSWRGRGNINVAALAAKFGGGGHAKAAGCTVEGNIEEVRQRVITEVCNSLSGCEC